MGGMYQQLPFSAQEDWITVDDATVYSTGVILPKQCDSVGVMIEFERLGLLIDFGFYQPYVETSIEDATEWVDSGEFVQLISNPNVYTLTLSSPVLDQLRIRVDGSTTNEARFRVTWLASSSGLTLVTT